MSNWRDKFSNFMQGRYGGNDTLNKWLLGAFVVLLLLATLFQSFFLYLLTLADLIYAYFRIFSKNIPKRMEENQKFVGYKDKVVGFFKGDKKNTTTQNVQNKEYRIFKCPNCKQKVRVPKGRGKICITCPKCHTEFVKRS